MAVRIFMERITNHEDGVKKTYEGLEAVMKKLMSLDMGYYEYPFELVRSGMIDERTQEVVYRSGVQAEDEVYGEIIVVDVFFRVVIEEL